MHLRHTWEKVRIERHKNHSNAMQGQERYFNYLVEKCQFCGKTRARKVRQCQSCKQWNYEDDVRVKKRHFLPHHHFITRIKPEEEVVPFLGDVMEVTGWFPLLCDECNTKEKTPGRGETVKSFTVN